MMEPMAATPVWPRMDGLRKSHSPAPRDLRGSRAGIFIGFVVGAALTVLAFMLLLISWTDGPPHPGRAAFIVEAPQQILRELPKPAPAEQRVLFSATGN